MPKTCVNTVQASSGELVQMARTAAYKQYVEGSSPSLSIAYFMSVTGEVQNGHQKLIINTTLK